MVLLEIILVSVLLSIYIFNCTAFKVGGFYSFGSFSFSSFRVFYYFDHLLDLSFSDELVLLGSWKFFLNLNYGWGWIFSCGGYRVSFYCICRNISEAIALLISGRVNSESICIVTIMMLKLNFFLKMCLSYLSYFQ